MQNNIELYELKYDKDNIQIIGREKISMSMLISDLDKWHKELTDIILLPNNLYYFATNNFDSDTYLEELTNENFEGVKSALEVIIKHPETFFEEYKQKSENYLSVENAQSYKELEKVTQLCGLKISNYSGMDLEKAKLKIQSKLCSDYCFGVFGEILFYAVAENLLCNKLVISKVELITAPNTNAHGSDGVFCDDINKILYFGEAKFTVDLDLGISQALSSMEHCIDRIKIDKDFMLVHQKDMKNGYGHIIRRDNINEYECRILIFLLHGVEIDNAETNDITDLEEAVYLNKSIDDLDEDNLDLYNRLIEILARYGKTLEDLKNTDGFVIREFIQLFDNLDSILLKADKYIKAEEKEKYLIKNDIIESFVKIIKYTRQYMLVEINNNLPKKKRIKGVVCVSKLLNLKPESIYQRIQKEIKEHQADMDEATLNLFIDYLFDLAFSYIKYDLTRMVRYFDFIFSKEYLENKNNLKDKIAVIESIFLHRLRIYCCDNDLLLKILIDLDLPYRDAKEISKMLVELDKDNISTSTVMDMLEFKYDEILKSKKIDNVSKDLLKILLNK